MTRKKMTFSEELVYLRNWFEKMVASVPAGVDFRSDLVFVFFNLLDQRRGLGIKAAFSVSFSDRNDDKAYEYYLKLKEALVAGDESIRWNWQRDKTFDHLKERTDPENQPLKHPERPWMLMINEVWNRFNIPLSPELKEKRKELAIRSQKIIEAHLLWRKIAKIDFRDLPANEKTVRKSFNLVLRLNKEARITEFNSDKESFKNGLLAFIGKQPVKVDFAVY